MDCGFICTRVRNGKDHKVDYVMNSALVSDKNEGWAYMKVWAFKKRASVRIWDSRKRCGEGPK